jgi:hypothetical protein
MARGKGRERGREGGEEGRWGFAPTAFIPLLGTERTRRSSSCTREPRVRGKMVDAVIAKAGWARGRKGRIIEEEG